MTFTNTNKQQRRQILFNFFSFLVPPSILSHPSNISNIKEWKTIELICTATGTLPIIKWFKVGEEITSGALQSNSTINSTVS